MSKATGQSNRDAVLDYLDAVFNRRDLAVAESYWGQDMIQHNPTMPNGLGVLRGFITSDAPPRPTNRASRWSPATTSWCMAVTRTGTART